MQHKQCKKTVIIVVINVAKLYKLQPKMGVIKDFLFIFNYLSVNVCIIYCQTSETSVVD